VFPDIGNGAPQAGDQPDAVDEVGFFGIKNALERAALERQDIDAVMLAADAGRVTDDIDEAVKAVQAAKEVIVLAIGTRKEGGEILEACAL
jgi:hypothetical protein